MDKKSKYADAIIIAFLILFTVDSLIAHFKNGVGLPLNNYLGYIALFITVTVYLFRASSRQYFLLTLLILYSCHLVDFSYKHFSISSGSNVDETGFTTPRIVPIAIILLVSHLICKWAIPIHRFMSQTPFSKKFK